MINTDKWTCRELVELLVAHGVKRAVLSPGTRNAPLIMAFSRSGDMACFSVIDERSAAFVALGMASCSGEPVAVVCTSGTALLNYAPAVAEAYYRHIPLIVVSADRPAAWIGQDDSQTLVQPDALSNYVLKAYSFNASPADEDERWMINRRINEGMLAAVGRRKGPVHFNVAIGEPISSVEEVDRVLPRVIRRIDGNGVLPAAVTDRLALELASPIKVMIVVGFHAPDPALRDALRDFARNSNVVVLAERTANLRSGEFINVVDESLFMSMSPTQLDVLRPDVVISVGGSLVSRPLKERLRQWKPVHWYVGHENNVVDCFMSLDRIIEAEASSFFRGLVPATGSYDTVSPYSSCWHRHYRDVMAKSVGFNAPWSDMAAIRYISEHLPEKCNLQVSNGMTLRYLLSAPCLGGNRVDCNRGVSGIDGSTSTAVGASVAYDGTTVLLTGDMSAQYDVAALASSLLTPKFKMIVIANGDGGIFRVIKTTRALSELNGYIASHVNFPAEKLADIYGFACYEASCLSELQKVYPQFISENRRQAMLVIRTDSKVSASVVSEFYRFIKFKN